jgi:hypothetical protein
MSWNPKQKIYVDDNGLVWDVTDEYHPFQVGSNCAFDPPRELELTNEDRELLAGMKVKI